MTVGASRSLVFFGYLSFASTFVYVRGSNRSPVRRTRETWRGPKRTRPGGMLARCCRRRVRRVFSGEVTYSCATTRGAPTAFNMIVVIAYRRRRRRRLCTAGEFRLFNPFAGRVVNFQVFFFFSFRFTLPTTRGEATAAGDAQCKTDPCEKGANPATNVVATAWQNNNNDTRTRARTKRTENKWLTPPKAIRKYSRCTGWRASTVLCVPHVAS